MLFYTFYYCDGLSFIYILDSYEARTTIGLGVSRCPIRVGVRHPYDTHTTRVELVS